VGDGACEEVGRQIEVVEVRVFVEIVQGASDEVGSDEEVAQVRQPGEIGGNGSSELVIREGEDAEGF